MSPRQAAAQRAVLRTPSSARIPSKFSDVAFSATSVRKFSEISTFFIFCRISRICVRSSSSFVRCPSKNFCGSSSKSIRTRTISRRSLTLKSSRTKIPCMKRSVSCGRKSPSSGFIEPINMYRALTVLERPSLSMRC